MELRTEEFSRSAVLIGGREEKPVVEAGPFKAVLLCVVIMRPNRKSRRKSQISGGHRDKGVGKGEQHRGASKEAH